MIPRDIHITWKTKDRTAMPRWMPGYLQGWQDLNPRHRLHLWDDQDCEELIRSEQENLRRDLGIDIVDLYHQLAKPVEKSDLWRYVVIYTRGGIYTDADTACLSPCDEWILPEDRALVGFESFKIEHPTQYCQWTFAAEPGHPFLGLLLQRVARAIHDVTGDGSKATLQRTGPLVFTDALIEFVNAGGDRFLDVAGKDATVSEGLRLLNKKAFCGGFVYHRFAGTWKHWLQRPGVLWRAIHTGRSKPWKKTSAI